MSNGEKPRTFHEVVLFCARHEELVRNWERLFDRQLLPPARPPARSVIDRLVDEAVARDWQPTDDAMAAFTQFVWECVWTRLPDAAFEQDSP